MFKQSVIALPFFRKIIKIERFPLQAAMLVFTCTLPLPPPSVDTRPRWPPVNARAWSRRSYEKKGTVNSLHFLISFLLQLESLRSRLDDREEQLKQKEKKLISVSSEHSENSYAVENLQSVLNTKERQVTSLKKKVCSMYSVFFKFFHKMCKSELFLFIFTQR